MAQQPHDTLQICLISYHGTPTSCSLGPRKKKKIFKFIHQFQQKYCTILTWSSQIAHAT